jgi:GMP synthase (glutamine-hydrolysing)
MRPVCLYVVGEPPPEIRAAFGDYADWFRALAELTPVDGLDPAPEIATPAWLRRWSAVVITGSPASVVGAPPWPEPWVERAAQIAVDAPAAGVPVLGVCYGHQLVAAAHGGQVRLSPGGWQGSTVPVDVSEAGRRDPLFDGVEPRFGAQQCHSDEVVPGSHPAIEVLATGPRGVEAIAVGEAIRGVQFHPEFSADVTRAYVELNVATGEPRPAPTEDTPQARRVLSNFIRHFAERAW